MKGARFAHPTNARRHLISSQLNSLFYPCITNNININHHITQILCELLLTTYITTKINEIIFF